MQVINENQMNWKSIWVATIFIFVLAVQYSISFTSLWPYLRQIDSTADQTFYGIALSAFSFGQMISSPVFGLWNNRMKKAQPAIVLGACISIAGNIVLIFTEASSTNRKWIILCARFLIGTGAGNFGIVRAYIANASTMEKRNRAIAIGTAATALGFTGGPAFQAAVAGIGYPGLVAGPFHISEYTMPAYLSILGMVVLVILSFTIFKENYVGIDEKKTEDPFHIVPAFDRIAAWVCILCWFTMYFVMINQETVETPYTMIIYEWTNSESLFYNSIIFSCSSVIMLVVYIALAVYGGRVNERVCLFLGLIMVFVFYGITFPWSFFGGRLNFKQGPSNITTSTFDTPIAISSTTMTSIDQPEPTGCDSTMEWCNYTPKLPILVYLISYPLMSIGKPLISVTASTLFSKILGPRRQGFMQSLMIMAGSSARLLAPVLISWLFEKFGPRIAWTMTSAVLSLCITLVAICYHRFVPLEMKPKIKSGQKIRYDGGLLYHF